MSDAAINRVGAYGAGYHDVAVGVYTAIAPAVNVAGIWLRTASGWIYANESALYADTAAPAGMSDTTKRKLMHFYPGLPVQSLPRSIFLPPGVGVYYTPEGGTNRLSITYDVEV